MMCETEAEEQSDVEDTSLNESVSEYTSATSLLDTSAEKVAESAKPDVEQKSPVVETPAPKATSPVKQVILLSGLIHWCYFLNVKCYFSMVSFGIVQKTSLVLLYQKMYRNCSLETL